MTTPRKGASRRADVPADVLARLNAGTLESATLAEALVIDFAELMAAVRPDLDSSGVEYLRSVADRGITNRMQVAAVHLLGVDPDLDRWAAHPSDTVRGWACYMIALSPQFKKLKPRLDRLKPLADDPHFGVREWAWLAMRPHLIASVSHFLAAVGPWTKSASANLRRFAVESTRPRGVWSAHAEQLKQNPALGLPLLEPVRADPSRYVQDSVANWLNDAGKSQPAWVRQVLDRWRAESPGAETEYIVRRAGRGLT